MKKAIAIMITLLSAYKMYVHWDNVLFDAWFFAFIGWLSVFFFEIDEEKRNDRS
jgi:hypothetical protein